MTDADIRRCAYLVVGRFLTTGNRKTILALVNDAIGFGAPEGARPSEQRSSASGTPCCRPGQCATDRLRAAPEQLAVSERKAESRRGSTRAAHFSMKEETMSIDRATEWMKVFQARLGEGWGVGQAGAQADHALAEYDKRFPPPSLDAAMDKATDEEIGKLRALVLRGAGVGALVAEWVCHSLCVADHPPRGDHHPHCVGLRQWLADCKAEGLE